MAGVTVECVTVECVIRSILCMWIMGSERLMEDCYKMGPVPGQCVVPLRDTW